MHFILLLAFNLFSAPEIPKLESCYNEDLFKNTTVEDHFAKRRNDAKCRGGLKEKYTAFRETATAIEKLVKEKYEIEDPKKKAELENKIQQADADLEKKRTAWLTQIRDCGPCQIGLNGPFEIGNSKFWYNSEGTCEFSAEDLELFQSKEKKVDASKFYEKGRQLLLSPTTYEKSFNEKTLKLEGLFHLLRFAVYDPEKGKRIPFKKEEQIKTFPFYTFVSVRGQPSVRPTAIAYFIRNYQDEKNDNKDELLFKFSGIEKPKNVDLSSREFRSLETTRSGQTVAVPNYTPFFSLIETKDEKKPQVQGLWCIKKKTDKTVVFSYRTNANLGVLSFLKEDVMRKFGENMHTDMLLQFYEKVLEEFN